MARLRNRVRLRFAPCERASALARGLAVFLAFVSAPALAHDNEVEISVRGGLRCITSNGLPNHDTGRFPNSGNPNSISEQDVRLCVTTHPVKRSRAEFPTRGSIGVAINGVQIRPSTADYYDASSPRGFSRDSSSGWRLEGLGAGPLLGMDQNNAHVDQTGLYHYHGIADALVASAPSSLIGYATDGFEIHVAGETERSSYQLKSGQRPSAPGGRYDGTYNEDWEYVEGAGTLDACNGGMLQGQFVYFATSTYPFFPRCLWGEPSHDFAPRRGSGGRTNDPGRPDPEARRGGQPGPPGNRRGPPEQAVSACRGHEPNAGCSFTAPHDGRRISGSCRTTPGGFACVPDSRRP
jgi:hypothetical protein